MTLSLQEFDAIQKLPPDRLYKYFLNKIGITGLIWYSKDDEVLTFNYSGGDCCPIWTAPEFAVAATAHLETPELKPVSISVREFADEFVKPPYDGLWVAVMLKADGEAFITSFEALRNDLVSLVLPDQLEEAPDLEALGPDATVEEQVRTIYKRNMKAGPKGKLPG